MRVFITSTPKELEPLRRQAVDAVRELGLVPITPEANAPTHLRPVDACVRQAVNADAVLAIVVFLWSVVISDENDQDLAIRTLTDLPVGAVLIYIAASGALYWRRSQPLVVMGVDLVAASVLLMAPGYPHSLWAMPFALYSVGRYASNDRWSYCAIGATLALVARYSQS